MTTLLIPVLFVATISCGGKGPAAGENNASPFVDHSTVTECARCHEPDRPKTSTHPASGDCLPCHKYPSWAPTSSLR